MRVAHEGDEVWQLRLPHIWSPHFRPAGRTIFEKHMKYWDGAFYSLEKNLAPLFNDV
jgi:hypothetical protein